jgi:hypothetical protein
VPPITHFFIPFADFSIPIALFFYTHGFLFNTHRLRFNTHRFRSNSLFRGARGLSLLCCAFRRSAGISTTASPPKWPSTSSSPQD